MATSFSVLVPLSSRPDFGHRDRAWAWLERRWRQTFPEAELVVESPSETVRPGEFNHPAAINAAVRRASNDVLVEADADTAFDPGWVREAVELVASGEAKWVLPRLYRQLTDASTKEVLELPPDAPLPGGLAHGWQGDSVSWSGLIVMPREGFEAAGGFPTQFREYGPDDVCFGVAMDTLWGRHTRLEGTASHLWHPVTHGPDFGHKILHRYLAAVDNPEAMREVVVSR